MTQYIQNYANKSSKSDKHKFADVISLKFWLFLSIIAICVYGSCSPTDHGQEFNFIFLANIFYIKNNNNNNNNKQVIPQSLPFINYFLYSCITISTRDRRKYCFQVKFSKHSLLLQL